MILINDLDEHIHDMIIKSKNSRAHESPGMVTHACNPNCSGGGCMRISSSRSAWAKVIETLSQKIK
jgi:hypothetical protein